eukprot:GEMP01011644.1.p1 GENE.GEMP01011644.1~~GEMP01011644.1.p1  ORF type:complete len:676 (+),score=155.91 GEMP01011644.1:205-2232(+)
METVTSTALEPYRAGPMIGNYALKPQDEERTLSIPGEMSAKVLIFVCDLENVALYDVEERKLDELTEDIMDAFGLSAAGKRLQFIFAGYDGVIRAEIHTDSDLMDFFSKCNICVGGELESAANRVKAEVRGLTPDQQEKMNEKQNEEERALAVELAQTRSELVSLRLGGILTKMQMQKFIRALSQTMREVVSARAEKYGTGLRVEDLEQTLAIEKEHYDILEASIPNLIDDAVAEACRIQQTELEQKNAIQGLEENCKQLNGKLMKQNVELNSKGVKIKKLERALTESREKVHALEIELQKSKDASDVASDEASLQELGESNALLAECYRLLEQNGIPRPGQAKRSGENVFRWSIVKFTDRTTYLKNHAVQSSEFQLEAFQGNCQIEFFPGGLDSSYEGWCALKLRLPPLKRLRLEWRITLGEKVLGPRTDEFDEDHWWCRGGQLMWSNLASLEDVKEQTVENALPIVLEVLQFSFLEGIPLVLPLHRLQRRIPSVDAKSMYKCASSFVERVGIVVDGEYFLDDALQSIVIEYLRQHGILGVPPGRMLYMFQDPSNEEEFVQSVSPTNRKFAQTYLEGFNLSSSTKSKKKCLNSLPRTRHEFQHAGGRMDSNSPTGKMFRSSSMSVWGHSPGKMSSALKPLRYGQTSQSFFSRSSPERQWPGSPIGSRSPVRKEA